MPIAFVTNALSPAKVQRVSIVDDRERVMEVIVEDKQLSLAIGKKGQNVRLAAKLTGWRIDIKSEEEKRREVEAQFENFEAAPETSDVAPRHRTPRSRGGRGRGERAGAAAGLHVGRHRRQDRSQAGRGRLGDASKPSRPRQSNSSRRFPESATRQPKEFLRLPAGKRHQRVVRTFRSAVGPEA